MKIKTFKLPDILVFSLVSSLIIYLFSSIWKDELVNIIFITNSNYYLSIIILFIILSLIIWALTAKNYYFISNNTIEKHWILFKENINLLKYKQQELTFIEIKAFYLAIFKLKHIKIADKNNVLINVLVNEQELDYIYDLFFYKERKNKEPYYSKNIETSGINLYIHNIINSFIYFLIICLFLYLIFIIIYKLNIITEIGIKPLNISFILLLIYWAFYYFKETKQNIKISKTYIEIYKGTLVKSTYRIPNKGIAKISSIKEIYNSKNNIINSYIVINDSLKIHIQTTKETIKEIENKK